MAVVIEGGGTLDVAVGIEGGGILSGDRRQW